MILLKIVFVGLNKNEEAICYYDVPLKQNVAIIYDMASTREEGVSLDPAPVSKKEPKQENLQEIKLEGVNDK